jgi:uncharacterized protein Smg (DUF494 family)
MLTVRERLIRLLVLLLESATAEERDPTSKPALHKVLSAAGVDADELAGLLAWLETLPSENGAASTWLTTKNIQLPIERAVRLQTDDERRFLSPDAFGYLIRLCGEDQISWHQFETVVQVASLASPYPLSRDDIGLILDQVLLTVPAPNFQAPAPENNAATN